MLGAAGKGSFFGAELVEFLLCEGELGAEFSEFFSDFGVVWFASGEGEGGD